MSLSNTSQKFLSELGQALSKTERDGPEWYPDSDRENPIFLIGNGGSWSIASHICNDLIKNDRAAAFVPDISTITCLANDFGWERVFDNWLFRTQHQGTLVAISSSGRSENIINACTQGKYRGDVITFTGFDADNPLRKMGDTNYYVPSHNYGIVECAHLAILHSIINPGNL